MIIKTPSRIHMALIDLNASLGRMDGGIGLALKEPCIEIGAKKADEVSAAGPLSERAEEAARRVLATLKIRGGIKIDVLNAYGQHIGLGSGTQIALAAGVAVCKLYREDMKLRDLARIIGRGGTSGIGVGAFESGGFILDGGHSVREKEAFLPSAASTASPPPILARYDFPDWRIGLVVPEKGVEFAGRREAMIFQEFCPIPPGDVEKLSRLILMKILPSILEKDVETFGRGINDIQKLGFKKIEVTLQAPEVRALMDTCRKYSYGVGLSSFGPAIYCIVRDENGLKSAVRGMADITITRANNRGTTINDVTVD